MVWESRLWRIRVREVRPAPFRSVDWNYVRCGPFNDRPEPSPRCGYPCTAVSGERSTMTTFPTVFALSILLAGTAIAQISMPVPSTRPPTREVIDYVHRQPIPGNPILLAEELIVGQPIPSSITLSLVPNTRFAFAIINHKRVIVDSATLVLIQVVD